MKKKRTILDRVAQRAGMSPDAYLQALIGRHPTLRAAANELGVDENTLLRWRNIHLGPQKEDADQSVA